MVLRSPPAIEALNAQEVLVSGQGLREGVVYDAMGEPGPATRRGDPARPRSARWPPASPRGTRARWAEGRVSVARPSPGRRPGAQGWPGVPGAARRGRRSLDVGRSVDYYRRFEHTADMLVRASDLVGFTHRKLALLAAVVRQAGDREDARPGLPAAAGHPRRQRTRGPGELPCWPWPTRSNNGSRRAAKAAVRCEVRGRTVVLDAPILDDPSRRDASSPPVGSCRVFGKRLEIQPDGRSTTMAEDPTFPGSCSSSRASTARARAPSSTCSASGW